MILVWYCAFIHGVLRRFEDVAGLAETESKVAKLLSALEDQLRSWTFQFL